MTEFNLVLSTDINYLPYTFVACQSVIDAIENKKFEGSSDDDKIIFNVLVDESVDIEEVKNKSDSFVERNRRVIDHEFKFYHVDSSIFEGCIKYRNSLGIYYRLAADNIFDKSIETLLYLDVDVLVLADVRELFATTNLEGRVLGAVNDFFMITNSGKKYFIKSHDSSVPDLELDVNNCFNSGVLLINMNEWRAQNIGERSRQLAKQYSSLLPDQDILNYLNQNYYHLNYAWNFYNYNFCLQYNADSKRYDRVLEIPNTHTDSVNSKGAERNQFLEAVASPKILHFNQNHKPWNIDLGDNWYHWVFYNLTYIDYLNKWYDTAHKVEEYSDKLTFNFINKASIVSIAFKEIMQFRRKVRKQRNLTLIICGVLLIMQIITMLYVFLD